MEFQIPLALTKIIATPHLSKQHSLFTTHVLYMHLVKFESYMLYRVFIVNIAMKVNVIQFIYLTLTCIQNTCLFIK